MSNVNLLIVYYSSTGTNYQLASAAEEAAKSTGANVYLRKVPELAPDAAIDSNPAWRATVDATAHVPEVSLDDLEWANAYIFGTPTRFGNMTAQMKQFIDTTGGLWFQGKLANKVVAGFTSAQNDHGGQESTLLSLYNTFYHWGCIIVPPGYTDGAVFANGGNPYGVSTNGVSGGEEIPETAKAAVAHLTNRVLTIGALVAAG